MKRIIEIDEKIVETLKTDCLDFGEIHEVEVAITNGIPYEERLKGEWVCITEGNLGINTYKCSLCGHQITCTEGAMKQHKGCYCGAVMKGGAE